MSAAVWYGRELILGIITIGRVAPNWKPGENGETWAGISLLPGARQVLGPYSDEATAREMVMKSAQSRIKGMFGAGIDTTASAVSEGRELRTTARAVWRAGVWRCDRPINAHAMFADLGRALGFKPEDAPSAASEQGGEVGSSAEPPPDPVDMIERE
jgi:plasmid stability protein